MKRTLLIVFVLLLTTNVFADKLILKNGKTAEGKIVEQAEDAIKIDIEGVEVTFFMEDIESIEKEVPVVIVEDEEEKQELIEKLKEEGGGYNIYTLATEEEKKKARKKKGHYNPFSSPYAEIDPTGKPLPNVGIQFQSIEEWAQENPPSENGPGYGMTDAVEEHERKAFKEFFDDKAAPQN